MQKNGLRRFLQRVRAVEPKKIITITGDFHGIDMLVRTGLKEDILDWINARMTE